MLENVRLFDNKRSNLQGLNSINKLNGTKTEQENKIKSNIGCVKQLFNQNKTELRKEYQKS